MGTPTTTTIASTTITIDSTTSTTPGFIVLTGDGKNMGLVLGEYHLIDPEQIIYQQSSSEKQDEKYVAKYIYRVEGSGWWVGSKVGEKAGWISNPSLIKTLPRSGWGYGDGTGTFPADDSITVNEGRLISDCPKINITLTGAALQKWPEVAGVYTVQPNRFFSGRHIYKNEENWLLHCSNEGVWFIGDKLGYYGIKSRSAPMIPSSSDEWFYWTGTEAKEADVEVTCIPTN